MCGKEIKVFSNDVYGNADDRILAVFAAFEHKKYMNKYCIFSIVGEYNKNKLYYGSVHFKQDSIVIFEIPSAAVPYIDTFREQLLSNSIDQNEYQLFDISNIRKAELISFTETDYNDLVKLDQMTVKREVPHVDTTPKKKGSGGLVFLLIIFVAIAGGLIYLYLNPELLEVKYKLFTCNKDDYDMGLDLNYSSQRVVKFDKNDMPIIIEVKEVYKFKTSEEYKDFKDNQKEQIAFKHEGGEFRYDDLNHQLTVFYSEKTIMRDSTEMKHFLNKRGYTCEEGTYEAE